MPGMDLGWTFDQSAERWTLLDHHGDPVRGASFTAEAVGMDLAGMNAFGARRGWPELFPGRPYIHCVLTGGPLDGQHLYFSPADREGPPQILTAGDEPLPGMPAGAPDPAVAVVTVVYERQPQPCGHGNSCGWPYRPAGTEAG
jgi:hypothetical protein